MIRSDLGFVGWVEYYGEKLWHDLQSRVPSVDVSLIPWWTLLWPNWAWGRAFHLPGAQAGEVILSVYRYQGVGGQEFSNASFLVKWKYLLKCIGRSVNCCHLLSIVQQLLALPHLRPNQWHFWFGSFALSQVQLARLVGHWLVLHNHNRPWLVVLHIFLVSWDSLTTGLTCCVTFLTVSLTKSSHKYVNAWLNYYRSNLWDSDFGHIKSFEHQIVHAHGSRQTKEPLIRLYSLNFKPTNFTFDSWMTDWLESNRSNRNRHESTIKNHQSNQQSEHRLSLKPVNVDCCGYPAVGRTRAIGPVTWQKLGRLVQLLWSGSTTISHWFEACQHDNMHLPRKAQQVPWQLWWEGGYSWAQTCSFVQQW